MGVWVGFSVGVGVIVGSSVKVDVGRLVGVGIGVCVGFGAKAPQDVKPITKIEIMMELLTDFILSLAFCVIFCNKHPMVLLICR